MLFNDTTTNIAELSNHKQTSTVISLPIIIKNIDITTMITLCTI